MNLLNWKKPDTIKEFNQDSPLYSLQNEFAKTISAFNKMMQTPSFSSKTFEELTIHPSIDVVEDNQNFKIEAEMPGLSEEDVHVTIGDGVLVIKGEKSTSKKDKDKNYVSREIGYGYYMRSIPLPTSLDLDKAKASFKKGMLWIVIPKKATAHARQMRDLKIDKA